LNIVLDFFDGAPALLARNSVAAERLPAGNAESVKIQLRIFAGFLNPIAAAYFQT